ncbi:hypothetical protein [Cellulomonas terrae]|uniref:hypothetical protein n=1 Tax=Cellulomonas terrae TaxID=311234 RepID=UPI0011BD9787|nr:hypothetical protein [Cellulomonas terrae]
MQALLVFDLFPPRAHPDVVRTALLWSTTAFVLICLWSVWRREQAIRKVTREFPVDRGEVRRAARALTLLGRPRAVIPADAYARTHRVVVAPLGDGRPGESFWGPGENRAPGDLSPDGSRLDVGMVLAERTHLLVVCLGRVGTRLGDVEVHPAAERVRVARESLVPPQAPIGPVSRVDSAMGVGWRTTCTSGGASTLTDTHVDRDGWAFVVGVVSYSWHERAVGALDAILSTWEWIEDGQPVA